MDDGSSPHQPSSLLAALLTAEPERATRAGDHEGRHYSTYVEDVKAIKRAGDYRASHQAVGKIEGKPAR